MRALSKTKKPDADKSGHGIRNINSYFALREQCPLLTKDQEYELLTKIKQGDAAARETLIHSNYAAVVDIAKRYENEHNALEDLVQDGLIGLIEAIDKFDLTQNTKFITYATPYINFECQKAALKRSSVVSVTYYSNRKLRSDLMSVYEKKNSILNGETAIPTDEDIKIDYGSITAIYTEPARLDAPIKTKNETDKIRLQDVIPDETAQENFASIERREILGIMMRNMKLLTQQQRTVIQLRFGFQDGIDHSFPEIGNELRCNRQYVETIYKNALQTLQWSLSETITETQKAWLNRLIEDSRSDDIDFF